MSSDFTHAFVRPPTRSLAECQLLHLPRLPLDFDRAVQQHHAYATALEQAGVNVARLPPAPELPDAAFVEDTVVVLDELAVLCRPGAASRLAEVAAIASAIAALHPVFAIQAPATLEGGDVLRVGRTLFVGRSTRTNPDGIRQFRQILSPFGYVVKEVTVTGCLHLKTAMTSPGGRWLLVNPVWLDVAALRHFEILALPLTEPWGANILPLNGRVLVAASAPQTGRLLETKGFTVHFVDISELQKAEAGLTCLSVLYRERNATPAADEKRP